MKQSAIQFITQTKLSELARQRDLLLQQYQTLLDLVASDELDSLTRLHKGLKDVRVMNSSLHRPLPNIDALLQSGSASESLIRFWHEKLMTEVRRGQLRANIVYLFGLFLSEWGDSSQSNELAKIERRTQKQQLIDYLIAPAIEPPLSELRTLLKSYVSHRETVSAKITEKVDESIENGATAFSGVSELAINPYVSNEVRYEARSFSKDFVLLEQFTDALRVVTRDPRVWRWADVDVSIKAVWTRNKWRLYPQLSLVELTKVRNIGGFWVDTFEDCFSSSASVLRLCHQLHKLLELNAPEVLLVNQRRKLSNALQKPRLDWYEPVDPWTGEILDDYSQEPVAGILTRRANKQSELRDPRQAGYGYDEGMNPMVQLVHAEIQTLRVAYPDKPIHVVKLDIKDYFATVPHQAIVTMLEGMGMPDDAVAWTKQFLAMPLDEQDRSIVAQRGVPMDQPYSHGLCEWLLRLMEHYVHQHAKLRIVRQIDDICLLAPNADDAVAGFETIERFLADLGLELNAEKCGSITIGGERSTSLPGNNPCWGMLALNENGDWQTDQPRFENYRNDARREVESHNSILAKTLTYNTHLKHLVSSVGLAMDLGDHHRQSVNRALSEFEQQFYSGKSSIFDGLHNAIGDRFSDEFGKLPTAWMVWPITAGGLGLLSSSIFVGQYQISYAQRVERRKPTPTERDDNWQHDENEWTAFYEDRYVVLEPANCAESATMKTMIESFIRRGQTISGGEQEGLTPYWRWTLSIFGPEILDRLGTFEFLIVELIPLQLIQEKRFHPDLGITDHD